MKVDIIGTVIEAAEPLPGSQILSPEGRIDGEYLVHEIRIRT